MIGKRLKSIREKLEFSQEKFGNKIGLSNSGVSKIESGSTNLSKQVTVALVREFNVNENWLLTGDGEMFVENDNSLLMQLSHEFNLTDLDFKLVETFLSLNPTQRAALSEFAIKFSKNIEVNTEEKQSLKEVDTHHII